MGCGRQVGGVNADDKGICPASVAEKFNGVNRGDNAGRFCWAVAGTLCDGEIQGTYAQKLGDCLRCKFLKQVNEDEGRVFVLIPDTANAAIVGTQSRPSQPQI